PGGGGSEGGLLLEGRGSWGFRGEKPQEEVRDHADPSGERQHDEGQTNHHAIDAQQVAEAGRDAGDDPVPAVPDQEAANLALTLMRAGVWEGGGVMQHPQAMVPHGIARSPSGTSRRPAFGSQGFP